MSEQLAFSRILAEAEEQRCAALDRHRQHVQDWFDHLPLAHKNQLAECMATDEWTTHAAISAAAGDWHRHSQTTNGK